MSSLIRTSFAIACLAMSCQAASATSGGTRVFTGARVLPGTMGTGEGVYREPSPQFQSLMAFGAASVVLMLFCKFHERQARGLMIGTAAFALMASIYGFLQSSWPLGVALGAYSMVSVGSWFRSRRRPAQRRLAPVQSRAATTPWEESRISRLFGPLN